MTEGVTTEDEVAPLGSGARGRDSGPRTARGSIVEDMVVGGLTAKPAGGARGEAEDVTVNSRGGGRVLSETAQKLLAKLDDSPPVAPAETPPAAAAAPAPATPASETPATPTPADPAAEYIARADRLAQHNAKLLAELESVRARSARGEPSARDKALDEAERGYLESPIASIRRLIATAIGVDDPKHEAVDAEMKGLYQDLTEQELGVSLDDARKAQREALRTRKLMERDRRERAAETAKPPEPTEAPEAKQTAEMAAKIAPLLAAGKHAERYPLLMALAPDFDGRKPEELLWHGIRRGIQLGELDPNTPDDKLIDEVSKKIETHYQALADKIVKARTPVTSTAPPTQASDSSGSKVDLPSNGVRTITNASASVAPATPPAAKPAPTSDTPPKYRNEKERRLAIARRLLDGAT